MTGVKWLALHSDSVWMMVVPVTSTSLKIDVFFILFLLSLALSFSHFASFKIPESLQAK